MKFFEAQKRASFATKLFATIGFDFDAALAANNETALKTAFDAHSSPAVEALFTSAGLKSADLVAAGPDALKLHIEGLDDSAAAADLTTKLDAATGQLTLANKTIEAHTSIFTAVGFDPKAKDKDGKPQDPKTAFEAHVKKAANLELAQRGHPAAHVPPSKIDDVTPVKTNEDHAAAKALTDYEALIVADNTAHTKESAKTKADFYAKNHALITRGLALRRR